MSKTIDNLIAFRVLYMLVTPFEKTDAFKLGIIDKDGKQLKKMKELTTDAEKSAYTNLHKLVFNLKKIIQKTPLVGQSQLTTLAAAYWLVKEAYENKTPLNEAYCLDVLSKNISFIEEELLVEKFFKEEGIANTTGAATSTDIPVIRSKGATPMFKRLKKKLGK